MPFRNAGTADNDVVNSPFGGRIYGAVRLTEEQMTLTERLFEIANIGAEWVLWLLLALSTISIAIMLERLFFLLRRSNSIGILEKQLCRLLDAGKFSEARSAFSQMKSMEATVLHAGLLKHAQGIDAAGEFMGSALIAQKRMYEKRLPFLATLGSNAPFIGLFGTVLGIIQAFAVFDINGGPESSAGIMSAISEALIATGVGLLVAIPAVVSFNFFNSKIKQTVGNTEQLIRAFNGYLIAKDTNKGGH